MTWWARSVNYDQSYFSWGRSDIIVGRKALLHRLRVNIRQSIVVVLTLGYLNRLLCSTVDPLPVPEADSNKKYPEKITRIVEDISRLTLLETAQLNELLKVHTYIHTTVYWAWRIHRENWTFKMSPWCQLVWCLQQLLRYCKVAMRIITVTFVWGKV